MCKGVGLRAQSLEGFRDADVGFIQDPIWAVDASGFGVWAQAVHPPSETSITDLKLQRFRVFGKTCARPRWLTSSSCRTWRWDQ